MKRKNLQTATVDQLVELFTSIAIEQDSAMLADDNAKFTKLYWEMDAIELELKSRHGDQRRAVLRLYKRPHMQGRLNAAIATLALASEAARKMLKEIAESGEQPQAGDAGMTLRALDDGVFVPV